MPDDYASEPNADMISEGPPAETMPEGDALSKDNSSGGPTFDLSIFVEPGGIFFQFRCEARSEDWTVPKTFVRRPHKAMPIDHVFDLLGAGPILGYQLREAVTNEPDFLMVPRAVNALTDRVTKALRRVQKVNALKTTEAAAEGSPKD